MKDYLLFRLYGPLVSWGEIAVGEFRHSAINPSKSALLGVLAAAIGIDRHDDARQRALAEGYRFAIKLVCVGMPMRDYHTIQSAAAPRRGRHRTRRQELAIRSDNATLLSYREYRCDSLCVVATEALPSAPHSLVDLVESLRRPRFSLYLGRKSCPPALPLDPRIAAAETAREALDGEPFGSLLALVTERPEQAWPVDADRRAFEMGGAHYYWEPGMDAGLVPTFEHERHDQPTSRSHWQFGSRREAAFIDGGDA